VRRAGHTLIEQIAVVLILSVLASVAVVRLHPAILAGVRAHADVRLLVHELRRTREEALLQAPTNPAGFAMCLDGVGTVRGYRIVDLTDSTCVREGRFSSRLRCAGGRCYAFGPLGNLKQGSDTQTVVDSRGTQYVLDVEPMTGAVRWARNGR
jgi:type II secretory pathway pseudopilin PulG